MGCRQKDDIPAQPEVAKWVFMGKRIMPQLQEIVSVDGVQKWTNVNLDS